MSTGNGNGNGKQAEQPRQVMVPPTRGETARQEFGAQQVARSGETASSAVAAQAAAREQARYVMALQRPRDMDMVRVRLLESCKRPKFAEAARYRKPVGRGIEGPSIRLAEEAARCMGNIAVDIFTVFDDDRQRIIRVCATDLETNLPYSADVSVAKTVERNNVPDGTTVLSQRIGSRGQMVYTVSATDDDILNKQNAITSKALRGNLLRLVPADILEEAMDQVYATLSDRNAKDPAAERKALMNGFAALNIKPDRLKEYLGHELDITTPAELVDLRAVYTAIRDGESTWAGEMEMKRKEREAADKPPAEPQPTDGAKTEPTNGKQSVESIAAAAKAKRESEQAKPPAAASQTKPSGPAQQTITTPAAKPAAPPPPDEDDRGDEPDWMKTPDGRPPEDE